MVNKTIPCSKLQGMIKEELKASKEYKDYGLDKLSKDEYAHAQYLKKIHKKKCKKK